MLEEKKYLIATRLKKSIDSSVILLTEINETVERIVRKNQQILKLSSVYKTWHDKVKKTY
ncbi:hypothetical protein TUBRATIS_17800 [Tubulinosema ratisbonensis]|uniref:Uncharacterized protein n=1 Tax=Tubulinosema ratisbonensis TaxID=291195 RepID=A0A437AL76_9MICR|nr:hypothetical protein TUBRATIS_17800 [Tubulinosema ratisbonensis]